jgi:hypothetical protein
MFLLYHSEGCNICGGLFRKCYINDLHTTTCSGMLGHRRYPGKEKSVSETCCSHQNLVTSFMSLSKRKLGGSSTQLQDFLLEKQNLASS